jgi:hypothetical protein
MSRRERGAENSVKQLLNSLFLCKILYLPMDDILSHERKRKWFVRGTVVTCTLSIPLIIGMSNAFRGVSAEKATGLAAVAGGLAEAYVTFGVVLAFALPITAIFLLSRSFARGHGVRSLFSLLCICWNALMLALAGLFLWLYLVYLPRAGAHPR